MMQKQIKLSQKRTIVRSFDISNDGDLSDEALKFSFRALRPSCS